VRGEAAARAALVLLPSPPAADLLPGAARRRALAAARTEAAARAMEAAGEGPVLWIDVLSEGLDLAVLLERLRGLDLVRIGPGGDACAPYAAALAQALEGRGRPAPRSWPDACPRPPLPLLGPARIDDALRELRRVDPPRARRLIRAAELAATGNDPRLDAFLGRRIEVDPPSPPAAAAEPDGPRHLVVEGIDGSGKSTQAAAIRAWLERRGIRAEVHKACRSGRFYERITSIMKHAEPTGERGFWRWCRQAKALDTVRVIDDLSRSAAARGVEVLIWDRHRATHLAASLARFEYDPWVREICASLPPPAAGFLLDIEVDRSLARVGRRDTPPTLDEQPFTLDRYRRAFLRVARREGLAVIDADRPEAEVRREILTHLEPLFTAAGTGETR